MDNEGFFAEDEPTGVAKDETTCATSCPECSSKLAKVSGDSDSYNRALRGLPQEARRGCGLSR